MLYIQVFVLAIVQGIAELLPVSSSAHVIVAEKLMGIDPSTPEMTLQLVALHTGTMLAVIYYFWPVWRRTWLCERSSFRRISGLLGLATAQTGIVGWPLAKLVARVLVAPGAEIEEVFGNLALIATALAVAGVLTLISGLLSRHRHGGAEVGAIHAAWIGTAQGFCLPFRGLSRSGTTISTGLLLGVSRDRAEAFSFALAVVLTPPVLAREASRLLRAAPKTAQNMAHSGFVGTRIKGVPAVQVLGITRVSLRACPKLLHGVPPHSGKPHRSFRSIEWHQVLTHPVSPFLLPHYPPDVPLSESLYLEQKLYAESQLR
ncbi:MAG: undecaprenyl-diphosphate phosphatase [Candidatus Hydrogenedentes bacterium]|nr:undecaprenyl-diphosphate phosphatase [Candidatus Hydrogenedentota bacterium]